MFDSLSAYCMAKIISVFDNDILSFKFQPPEFFACKQHEIKNELINTFIARKNSMLQSPNLQIVDAEKKFNLETYT